MREVLTSALASSPARLLISGALCFSMSLSPLCFCTVVSTRSGRGTSTIFGTQAVKEKLPICPIAACQGKFLLQRPGRLARRARVLPCACVQQDHNNWRDWRIFFFGYINYAHIYISSNLTTNSTWPAPCLDTTWRQFMKSIRWIFGYSGAAEFRRSKGHRRLRMSTNLQCQIDYCGSCTLNHMIWYWFSGLYCLLSSCVLLPWLVICKELLGSFGLYVISYFPGTKRT